MSDRLANEMAPAVAPVEPVGVGPLHQADAAQLGVVDQAVIVPESGHTS